MTSWKKSLGQLWFRVKSFIPTSYLLLLFAIGILITIIGAIGGWGWLFGSIYYGLLLVAVIADVFALKQYPKITINRQIDQLFELDQKNQVRIRLKANTPLNTKMWIQDDYPQGFWVDQRTLELTWSGQTEQMITYQTQPHRRGRHTFHSVHLRLVSQWQLFLYQVELPQKMEVSVYPSLAPTRKVRRGYYQKQPIEGGTSVARSFGTGKEFSHLREYLVDDESKNINWMATARSGKLVSNVYQPEVGQRVAILLDCGRLMGVQDDGRSRLDIALEAVLGFAAIALQRGDEVSFMAFSDRLLRWVPLGKGLGHLRKIVAASFDLEPSYVETDYLSAWEKLSSSHKQKTLVALFTDMANLSFAETIDTMIRHTQKKHLVLTISIQDSQWQDYLQRVSDKEEEIYEQLVVFELNQERKATMRKWGNRQLVALDVGPDKLASAVIYTYLDIRNKLES